MESSDQQNPGRAVEAGSARPPRRVFSLIGAVAAVVMAALLAQTLLANPGVFLRGLPSSGQQAPDGGQVVTPSGTPGVDYSAMTMVSPSDGWLFGATYSNNPAGGPCGGCSPFIVHYDGSQWRRVAAPATASIAAASMLSSTDGWAVAQDTIFHYTGGAWTVAYTYAVPNETIFLNAITMVSPDEGWVGGSESGPTTGSGFLLHYFSGKWQRVDLPDASRRSFGVNGISMLSPKEGWALEMIYSPDAGTGTRLIHYVNGAWHAAGDVIPATLTGLAAVSAQTVWMVGAVTGTTGGIFRYDAGQIAQVASPTPNILHAVTMLSPTDSWAVGDGAATLHWDGTQWTKVGLIIHGVALMGVSFAASGEGWAEGNGESSDAQGAMLLHYSRGAWRVYPLKIGG
ncbi:MAG TPA: hypothetical protein VKT52_00945 [Ktedonobacterales bacterium]|nr:hypothetical protein [Ktedonobacterales bacterium]